MTGDGNCLFRSISLAVSNMEDHHYLLRHAITDHQMQYLHRFAPSSPSTCSSLKRIENMKRNSEWGTDHEITAAANLLGSSIVCCSKYGTTNELCLQHFSPHMINGGECTETCNHNTIFLANVGGSHYDLIISVIQNIYEE